MVMHRTKFIGDIKRKKQQIISKHRVAQQRRFLAEKKKLQLQQFRTQQKLDIVHRKRKIRQQKELMRKIGQQRRVQQIQRAKKTLGAFGIRW